jgi:acetyl esterase/lipase
MSRPKPLAVAAFLHEQCHQNAGRRQNRALSRHVSDDQKAGVDSGYTAFVITHRAAPRSHYPDPVEDAQQAVRFIRHNASRYGIRGDRIGALGGSSGGRVVSMLGTLNGEGNLDDPDPVQHEAAKVQCVAIPRQTL